MRFFLPAVFLLFAFAARAQTRPAGQLTGNVVDSVTRKPLLEATVTLQQTRDSSLVAFQITNGEGGFSFQNLAEGRYRILVTYVGYTNASKVVAVSESNPKTNAGTLAMQANATMLNEVVIKQEAPPVVVKADTLEFNAGSFKARPNAQVEELLKKLPGMEVSRDGTVKAQGQEVTKILVDGKPFFGNDPKMATRNLPAEMIDKVQVYDQRSEQSQFSGVDDGDREKTINLITKRDRRKGTFGQGSAGYGTDERFSTRLNLNRFNNGRQISFIGSGNNLNQQAFTQRDNFNFGGGGGGNGGGGNTPANNITRNWAGGLNYRDAWGKKWEVAASYSANNTDVATRQQSRRQNILPDSSYFTDKTNRSDNHSSNHRFNLRLEYKIDSLTTLRIIPAISTQNSDYTSSSLTSSTTRLGVPINSGNTDYNSTGQNLTASNNALLLRKFARIGRTLSLSLNTNFSNQHTLGFTRALNTFNRNGQTSTQLTDQQNDQETRSMTNTIRASYTEPLSLSRTAELHYSYSRNLNTSDRAVADRSVGSGEYDRVNAGLSNRFQNIFATNRTGFTLQTKKLRYSYSLGADWQQAELSSNNETRDTSLARRYVNVLPNALLTYNFAKNRSLRLEYSSRINAPSVNQLQPVTNNTNPLYIQLGNPDLRPEYNNTLNVVYNNFNASTFRSFFVRMNATQTSRKIVNATSFNNVGVQTTRPVNAEGYYALTGFFGLGRPLKENKASLNLNTNLGFSQSPSLINNQSNQTRNLSVGQGVSLNSNFNDKLEFSVGGNVSYQTAVYSLQTQQNTEFFNKSLTADVYYQLPLRMVVTSDFTFSSNTGRSAGYNQNFSLWNLGLARQLFKNQQGELKLSVYDLLNQNRSLVRNIGDTYLEDVQSLVLTRYFLLSFTYNLRRFGQTGQRGGNNPQQRSPAERNFRQNQRRN